MKTNSAQLVKGVREQPVCSLNTRLLESAKSSHSPQQWISSMKRNFRPRNGAEFSQFDHHLSDY